MNKENKDCFVIMPISTPTGYSNNHFDIIYRHIIKPAIKKAGFKAIRADEVSATNKIIDDIIDRLNKSAIVLCDLSSNNPNVLYELGLRHAINKPTVLIKDDITKSIFDITMWRWMEYPSNINLGEDKTIIAKLKTAIIETYQSNENLDNINQAKEQVQDSHATKNIQNVNKENKENSGNDTGMAIRMMRYASQNTILNDYENKFDVMTKVNIPITVFLNDNINDVDFMFFRIKNIIKYYQQTNRDKACLYYFKVIEQYILKNKHGYSKKDQAKIIKLCTLIDRLRNSFYQI